MGETLQKMFFWVTSHFNEVFSKKKIPNFGKMSSSLIDGYMDRIHSLNIDNLPYPLIEGKVFGYDRQLTLPLDVDRPCLFEIWEGGWARVEHDTINPHN